jgi:hypothetical protein
MSGGRFALGYPASENSVKTKFAEFTCSGAILTVGPRRYLAVR